MSARKSMDRLCVIVTALTLAAALIFCCGKGLGIETAARVIGYESRLFDQTRVHSIDIVTDDWDGFLETCEREEYSMCSVVIDGEAYGNVGIRGKGNTSLSAVSSMGNRRYSFKIEFDHYDGTASYHGLDKLCLNNIIQDHTYMKDYLSYTLMNRFGVSAPLCSYAYITVNGEDWGLYLAVEGVEEAFLKRNYGSGSGELYKPDSMSFGGGRGNGMDFSMSGFMGERGKTDRSVSDSGQQNPAPPDGTGDIPDFGGNFPAPGNAGAPDFGGMGGDDVKLQYLGDDPESYANIFDNAKTDISDADQKRLIGALRALSEESDPGTAIRTDEVIRYFVVHNFLCNDDSYTGSMVHNYYLYEEDGLLSMIPWDYNLAFGTFRAGDAASAVNAPIDTPVSGELSDRPMIGRILENEETAALYHELFRSFVEQTDFAGLIEETAALIGSYVEKDPTKFCTDEEFQKGISAIREFCLLRAESVLGQLDGRIPADSDGQKADGSALIDASSLNLADMGTMENGGSAGGRNERENPPSAGGAGNPPALPENGESGNAVPAFGEDFPQGTAPDRRDRKAGEQGEPDRTENVAVLPLLGLSAAALIAGLIFALKIRPRK